jgi:sensor histidine kinase regulating citrate/malate metabolism
MELRMGSDDRILHTYTGIFLYYCLDNGGGMDPDKLRQCMSLGYSAKSQVANTIGQCKLEE